MTLAYLRRYRRLYLASPYTLRPDRERAHAEICAIAGHLMKQGLYVFCPIAHCHPIAVHAGIDPGPEFWVDHIRREQDLSDALVIAQMDGWLESAGISGEIAHAALRDQPTYALEPQAMTLTKWGFG